MGDLDLTLVLVDPDAEMAYSFVTGDHKKRVSSALLVAIPTDEYDHLIWLLKSPAAATQPTAPAETVLSSVDALPPRRLEDGNQTALTPAGHAYDPGRGHRLPDVLDGYMTALDAIDTARALGETEWQ